MGIINQQNTVKVQGRAIRAEELDAAIRQQDEQYMRRCLQLARQGRAGARPNPMVGAVVVHQGRIIGEGYHICQGGPHAEVNAIGSVRQTELLLESTIYVSLEPCAHYGKTPPCADLIISKHIRRCVVGCKDPFAKVDGLGIQKLLDAGVEVVVGVLEQECLDLNETFIIYHEKKRPFITLKWAQSRDGFMDGRVRESLADLSATHFSTPLTMALMHRRRSMSDAILVGGGTVLADNPSLTIRHWAARGETGNMPVCLQEKGEVKGNPLRVVIDTKGNLPANMKVFNDEADTLVWNNWNLESLLQTLHRRGVQTLLVEGGAQVLRRFVEAGLWDEARVETAPFDLKTGTQVDACCQTLCLQHPVTTFQVDGNLIQIYRKTGENN